MSDEAFNKHMERKHPTRQLTIQQSRTADEEKAWVEQQKQKGHTTAETSNPEGLRGGQEKETTW